MRNVRYFVGLKGLSGSLCVHTCGERHLLKSQKMSKLRYYELFTLQKLGEVRK